MTIWSSCIEYKQPRSSPGKMPGADICFEFLSSGQSLPGVAGWHSPLPVCSQELPRASGWHSPFPLCSMRHLDGIPHSQCAPRGAVCAVPAISCSGVCLGPPTPQHLGVGGIPHCSHCVPASEAAAAPTCPRCSSGWESAQQLCIHGCS